jgi:hypothetical protein
MTNKRNCALSLIVGSLNHRRLYKNIKFPFKLPNIKFKNRKIPRSFSLLELEVATDKFSDTHILGRDKYWIKYKGWLDDGTLVDVKRYKMEDYDLCELQFKAEVEMISMSVHRNLVRMQGSCKTPTERILVYPYMPNGMCMCFL